MESLHNMVDTRADLILILQPQLRCHLHLARETIMPAIDLALDSGMQVNFAFRYYIFLRIKLSSRFSVSVGKSSNKIKGEIPCSLGALLGPKSMMYTF
jgi:hypothetical protein